MSLVIQASDADGGTLSYAAAGLPAGLPISTISGVISGVPTAAGNNRVTVTVDDGEDSVSVSFGWTITDPYATTNYRSGGGGAFDLFWLSALALFAAYVGSRRKGVGRELPGHCRVRSVRDFRVSPEHRVLRRPMLQDPTER